jgi:hypothetical protein
MLYFTMGLERGTPNRVLAESLAAFYSKRLGYYVFVCVQRSFDKECEIY